MLLCTFLLASVGWVVAEEDGGGTTGITTLEALENAINGGATEITLGSDIENVTGAITISRALTLNGNGNTISGTVSNGALLEITGTGAVTITNLTVKNTNSEYPSTDILVEKEAGNENAVTFNTVKLGGSGYAGIKIVGGSVVSIESVEEIKEHPTYGIQLSVKDNKAPALKIGAGNKFPYCWYQIRQDQQYEEYPAAITAGEGCGFSFLGQGVWTDRYNSESKTYTIPIQDRTPTVILYELNITASIADIIKIGAGELDLSELGPLKIDKSVTIEGAVKGDGTPATTLQRGTDWSETDDDTKHMVNITASKVTLKNLVIDGNNRETGDTPQGSGINVYEASNVTLENVISKNNKGGGLIVNGSNVTAKNFHTEGNGYGINLDKGVGVTTNPTLSIDVNCSVAEESSKIYGPASLDANSVTMPNGWITTTVTLGETEYRVWTDKVITTIGKEVYANGYPITIEPATTTGNVKIYRTNYPQDYIEVAGASATIYGGSRNAGVANASITLKNAEVRNIFGGGYGLGDKTSGTPADVAGKAEIVIEGGTVSNLLVGSGDTYSHVKEVNITINANSKVESLIAGGFDAGQTTNDIDTELSASVNGVEKVTISIENSEVSVMGCGGGQGYSRTGNSTISATNTTIGKLYGTYSNGRADNINATFSNCTIKNELSTINRGWVTDANFAFTDCIFEETLYASLAATQGWANSDTPGNPKPTVDGTVTFTFTGENAPDVHVSRGLDAANVVLNGAKAIISHFDDITKETNIEELKNGLNSFTIGSDKTWTFNNGLELTSDVTLTQTGILVVNGTMKVATAEQAAEAILKGNAAVIDASSLTADAVLTAMGSTEATLKEGIKVIFSDKTAYTDMSSAQADLAGAEYIYRDDTNSKFVSITPSKDTPSIDEEDKPVGSTIDAGMPISASVLKGGSAKVEGKVIAGTFAWKNGTETALKGTNSYAVIFTPQDQIKYNTVETTAEIADVKAFAIVEPGVCINGKVVIADENIAHKYEVGSQLTVTAEPAAHYKFSSWADGLGSEATITYTVLETDATLVANFEPITHTVSFGEGITVMNGETTLTTDASVAEGTVLTVTASKVGSALTSLTCNDVAIINNQVTVDKDLTIKASFKSTLLPIVTATAKNGKVMLYDSKGNTIALGSEVAQGTVVTVVAVPDLGYKADALTATGVPVEQNQFTMGESNVTLNQTFKKLQFEVKSVAENATITLSPTGNVDYGEKITLSVATANAGYKLLGVFVNGKEIKRGDSFTVTAATTVQAVTAPLPAIQFVD